LVEQKKTDISTAQHKTFNRLRMIQRSVSNSSVRCANRQSSDVELISSAISILSQTINETATKETKTRNLGSLIDNLIKRRENVVGKLNLRNCSASNRRKSHAKADNSLLEEKKKERKKLVSQRIKALHG
jgi:hypothetical protein